MIKNIFGIISKFMSIIKKGCYKSPKNEVKISSKECSRHQTLLIHAFYYQLITLLENSCYIHFNKTILMDVHHAMHDLHNPLISVLHIVSLVELSCDRKYQALVYLMYSTVQITPRSMFLNYCLRYINPLFIT